MSNEEKIEFILFGMPALSKSWLRDDPPLIEMEKVYMAYYIDLAHWWYGLSKEKKKLVKNHMPDRLKNPPAAEKPIYDAIKKQHNLLTKHLLACEKRYKELES